MFLEYFPWSRSALQEVMQASAKTHRPSILDIQVGGSCGFNCLYCDTPQHHEPCLTGSHVKLIETIIATGEIKSVFCCGLGEPTAPGNVHVLKSILAMCENNSTTFSMFTNMEGLDDELFGYIKRGTLFVLVKLDTFVPGLMQRLYGISATQAKQMQYQYARLKEVVNCQNGVTNIGGSIVPTQLNFAELPSIIDWCMKNKFFPLIGPLEKAGKSKDAIYEQLQLRRNMLQALKKYVDTKYNTDYSVPFCPSLFFGLHIDNHGNVQADQDTGLSCDWFRLENPRMDTIGHISDGFDVLSRNLQSYRAERIPAVIAAVSASTSADQVFGGCGGKLDEILNFYLEISTP